MTMIQSVVFDKIQAGYSIPDNNFQKIIENNKTGMPKSANINLMDELEIKSNLNKAGIMKENFELAMTPEELEKRVQKDYLSKITLLKEDSPEFSELAQGDKKALKHLVKAANILNDVYLKQDNPKNIEFREFLGTESAKGNEAAKNALILFNAQKGVSAIDRQSKMVNLLKNDFMKEGKALYPQDLSADEFHKILISMIENGKIEDVRNILSQRTVVERKGDELTAIDYTKAYSKEFNLAADELEKAAKTSTNADFNEYLILQSKALRECDSSLDAKADKKWADLQNTPLEFTISRENYEDELTGTVFENEKLAKLLKEHNIVPVQKDFIGVRVGIVNKEGTDFLLKFKEFLPELAKEMPYNNEYEQDVASSDNVKQTMVDADLVIPVHIGAELLLHKIFPIQINPRCR